MKFYIFLFTVTLFGCFKTAEKLTLQKQEFIPSSSNKFLKTNGYYIQDIAVNSKRIFFLYRNGIILDWGGVKQGNNEEIDKNIRMIDSVKYHQLTQYGWGLFNVSSEDIIIEKWLSKPGAPYPVEQYKGKILNDSTISIFLSDHEIVGSPKPDIYKFRYFYPKPDSTNVFIK